MSSVPSLAQVRSSDRLRGSFDPLIVTRGELYALDPSVVTIHYGDANRVAARVHGTQAYEVGLRYTRRDHGGTLGCSCSCSYAQTTRRLCKHVWAALRVAERRGHLTSAARGRGSLEIRTTTDPPSLEEPGTTSEPRWLLDLPASTPYSGLVVDAYTSTLGRDRAWTTFRRDDDPEPDEPTPARIAALARAGRAEVLHRADRPPERLTFDEGEPFRLVLVVTEGNEGSATLGELVVRGELRRGSEAIGLDEMSAIYHDGIAFVGARAVRVERDAPLRWVTALQKRGNELLIEADEAPRFLRDLVGKSRRELFELPSSFELVERAAFATRVHVRRPQAETDAPPRSLHADVLFVYGSAVASWRDRGSLVIETKTRRIAVRDRDGEQAAVAELVAAGFSTSRSGRASAFRIPPARLAAAIVALPPERFIIEADGVVHRPATRSSLSVSSAIRLVRSARQRAVR